MSKNVENWVEKEQGKHFCECGCGKLITIKYQHYTSGIPAFILGHGNYLNESNKHYVEYHNALKNPPTCACGCGELIKIIPYHKYHKIPTIIPGHKTIGMKKNAASAYQNQDKNKYKDYRTLWFKEHQNKHFCTCGCGEKIMIRKKFFREGFPLYKQGHHPMGNTFGCYYETPLQGIKYLKSSYEIGLAMLLDELRIIWVYEIEKFDLGINSYTPDFFLPQDELFIETKGFLSLENFIKLTKFSAEYPWIKLELLFKKDLLDLGVLIGDSALIAVEHHIKFKGWNK